MEKGIVCFSFDDGRKDNKVVAELLRAKNIPASFNITSGYIDGTCSKRFLPCDKEALTIEDVRWLNAQKIFEIALHGDQHLNTAEDIKEGRKKIIKWLQLPKDSVLGFASPGTGIDFSLVEKEKKLFYEDISYIRISLRIKSLKYLRILARKVARVIHRPLLYKIAYKDTLMDEGDNGKFIYSVPVLGDITYEQVKALVDLSVSKRKALVLMFHSIHEKDGDVWNWNIDKFIKLCNYVQELRSADELEIYTVQQLYNLLH